MLGWAFPPRGANPLFEQYDALIFDMDGTLVDSMPLHLDAWQITSDEFQLAFDRELVNSYGGIPTRKIVAMLAEQQGVTIDVEAFTRRKIALYLQHIGEVSVFPTMAELVKAQYGKIPMGIGTGAPGTRRSRYCALPDWLPLSLSWSAPMMCKTISPTPIPSSKWPSCWGSIPIAAWCSKIPRSASRPARRRAWQPCWRQKVS